MVTLVVSVVYCLQVDGGLGCGADFGCVCGSLFTGVELHLGEKFMLNLVCYSEFQCVIITSSCAVYVNCLTVVHSLCVALC